MPPDEYDHSDTDTDPQAAFIAWTCLLAAVCIAGGAVVWGWW
jgi:hypothetical protein